MLEIAAWKRADEYCTFFASKPQVALSRIKQQMHREVGHSNMLAPEGSLPTFHGGALAPPRELGWGSSPQEAAVRFVRDGLHIQVQFRRKSTPGTTRTK